LEYSPIHIGEDFYCNRNLIASFKHAPKYVGGDFTCVQNLITSFEYAPKYIAGRFMVNHNPIESIYNNFIKTLDNIDVFNDFRIIKDNTINIKRLENYCRLNNFPEPNIQFYGSLSKNGYKLI